MKRTQKYKPYNPGESSQWRAYNLFCPECRATGCSAHKLGYKSSKIMISPTARFPTKNASEKIWRRFYKQFIELKGYQATKTY